MIKEDESFMVEEMTSGVDSSLKELYDAMFNSDNPITELDTEEVYEDEDDGEVKFDSPTREVVRDSNGAFKLSQEIVFNDEDIKRRAEKYTTSCVNDFPDSTYHLSNEEVMAQDKFMGQYKKIISNRTKINNLAAFIKVQREIYKFVEMIASDEQSNPLFSKEEFISMFLKGELKIDSLPRIKYTGKTKGINWKAIEQLCIHYDEEIPISYYKKSEQADILDEMNDNNEEREEVIRDNIQYCMNMTEISQEEAYGDVKPVRDITKLTGDALKKAYKIPDNKPKYAYDINTNDIDFINKLDKKRRYKGADVPAFTGDLMNDDDYNLYMYNLKEWEDEYIFADESSSKNPVSLEESYMNKFKRVLEEAGYNVRAMKAYQEKDNRKKLKKKARKKEKKLKNKLSQLYYSQQEYKKAKADSKKKKKKHDDDFDIDMTYKDVNF